MKEVTEWNGIPREMWVWHGDNSDRRRAKVVAVLKPEDDDPYANYHVICLSSSNYISDGLEREEHCAEIEDERRLMTNKELARWLRRGVDREYKCNTELNPIISFVKNYCESIADKEVSDSIVVREGTGEWQKPYVSLYRDYDDDVNGR